MLNVSVIIPNYNYGRFLAAALESVLTQTYAAYEVIVVDDGSTDDSLAVLAGYADHVSVLRQKNQGVGAARNAGVAAASGDLIAFLDADDYWLPRKLEVQVAHFAAQPHLGLVHCGVHYVDVAGHFQREDLNGRAGWVAEDLLQFRPAVVAPGSTSLIPRRVFQELGGFRSEQELPAAEDWEFSLRLACHYEIGFAREVLVHYRQHGISRHRNIVAMEEAMLTAFRFAFQDYVTTEEFRQTCYARLYMVLAGSYFRAGQLVRFGRAALLSLWHNPAEIHYLLQFFERQWQRLSKAPPATVAGNTCNSHEGKRAN